MLLIPIIALVFIFLLNYGGRETKFDNALNEYHDQ